MTCGWTHERMRGMQRRAESPLSMVLWVLHVFCFVAWEPCAPSYSGHLSFGGNVAHWTCSIRAIPGTHPERAVVQNSLDDDQLPHERMADASGLDMCIVFVI